MSTSASHKKYVKAYRARQRRQGGVIVYAMITDPDAVTAWKELQKVFGSNRDIIEDAIITSYENIKAGK